MSLRIVVRSIVDIFAIYCAFSIQFAASGSYAAAGVTTAGLILYSCWCYYDGYTARLRAQEEQG